MKEGGGILLRGVNLGPWEGVIWVGERGGDGLTNLSGKGRCAGGAFHGISLRPKDEHGELTASPPWPWGRWGRTRRWGPGTGGWG